MSHRYEDHIAWEDTSVEDLWVYDKLILSKKLGYTCGPAGTDVPMANYYVVRPITNMMGMGLGTTEEYLRKSTDDLPPGTFWCEKFYGDHYSVDFIGGKQVLAVQGHRQSNNFQQWDRWEKIDKEFEYPHKLLGKFHTYLNCEFIGNNLIECHLRLNPDFRYGYDVMTPVWADDGIRLECLPKGSIFIADREQDRLGFLARNHEAS